MKYDFETVIDRRNSGSLKWDIKENEIPLWVADMDFPIAPEIKEALMKRVEHGVFGYTYSDDEWKKAYIDFNKERHNVIIPEESIFFSLGVVPTISSTVRKLTEVGDNVVVLSPVYNIFYNSIINNQRNVYEVELIRKDDQYFIDFDSLETAFKNEKTKLLILCNPANPIGRIWTKEELLKIGELAYENNVIVLSDEIHAEITRPGKTYVPFFDLSEHNRTNSVTAISVTKPFNLAGIHTSAVIIPNPEIKKKVERQLNTDEVAEPNDFSCVASIAALNKGREWLDECRSVLFSNKDHAIRYINDEIGVIHALDGDATYLLWIDCRNIAKDDIDLCSHIRETTGLILSDGKVYGKGGEGYLRMNLACPRRTLDDALNRLKEAIESYISSN